MERAKEAVRRVLRKLGVPHPRTVLHRLRRLRRREQPTAAPMEVDARTTAVLNAIASTNGTARILRREVEQLRAELQAHVDALRALEARVEAAQLFPATDARTDTPDARGPASGS